MVDGTPQVHMLARDPHDHFVEMPSIARLGAAPPQIASDHRSEFEHPTANALVGDVEPTLAKQLLDIAIAQSEAQVEPNRLLNHGRRKTVPAIGDRKHPRSLRPAGDYSQVILTMPREALLAEQLAHELDGCALVPSALNQDLEDLAFMIDGTPQIHVLACNPDDHFVEMPAIARSRTAPPQSPGDRRS